MQHLTSYADMSDLPQVSCTRGACVSRSACGAGQLRGGWPIALQPEQKMNAHLRSPSPLHLCIPSPLHPFPFQELRDSMLSHLKLHFNNAHRADETVLG